jgi:hypothetical protein
LKERRKEKIVKEIGIRTKISKIKTKKNTSKFENSPKKKKKGRY